MTERDVKPQDLIDRAIATEQCRICNAKPGERCGSIVDASKYLDAPHFARVDAARRSTEAT